MLDMVQPEIEQEIHLRRKDRSHIVLNNTEKRIFECLKNRDFLKFTEEIS